MRPERTRATSSHTGIARARMYLKQDLGWLDGFPLARTPSGVEWCLRPVAGTALQAPRIIGRTELTQAHLTLGKLASRFPKAMPKLVGDVGSWRDRVLSLLQLLREILDGRRDLDELPRDETCRRSLRLAVSQLEKSFPRLTPIVRAATWSSIVDRSRRDRLLGWIVQNAEWLDRCCELMEEQGDPATVLLLVDWAEQDGESAQRFLRTYLSERARFRLPSAHLGHQLRKVMTWLLQLPRTTSGPPAPGNQTLGHQLLPFALWMARQAPAARQFALRLVGLLVCVQQLDEKARVWERLERDCLSGARYLQVQLQYMKSWEFAPQRDRLKGTVEALLAQPLIELPLAELIPNIQSACAIEDHALHDALCRALAAIPVSGPSDPASIQRSWNLRAGTFSEIVELLSADWSTDATRRRQACHYLILFSRFMAKHGAEPRGLLPWHHLIEQKRTWGSPLSQLLRSDCGMDRWPQFFDVIAGLFRSPAYEAESHQELILLMALSRDPEDICRRFHELSEHNLLDLITADVIRVAKSLESKRHSFGELCGCLVKLQQDKSVDAATIENLHRRFCGDGWATLVPDFLSGSESSELVTAANLLGITVEMNLNSEYYIENRKTSVPEWASALPSELQVSIGDLMTLASNPERTVHHLLKPHVLVPHMLAQEIQALEALAAKLPPDAHLNVRLTKLKARRGEVVSLSEADLKYLQEKVDRATQRLVLSVARQRIEKALTQALGDGSPDGKLIAWLKTPRHVSLLTAVLRLSEPFRALGLALIRQAWQPGTWDPRAEPANVAFLERMRKRGLDITAWLERPESVVVPDKVGQPVTIGFEDDPVEILLMGYHFDTCLGPHGCNFYSAVTNAVDVNKRVLIARNAKLRVVGRCLLALGDTGSLLTYFPYCDDPSLAFPTHVAQIANRLAIAMRTVVSGSDIVSPLVTGKWYDDGVRDLGHSLTGPESPLRRVIKECPVDRFLPELEAACGPAGLTEVTLGLILYLDELSARPELFCALLPLLEQYEAVFDNRVLVQAACLAHQAGQRDYAARILSRHAPAWFVEQHRKLGYFTPSTNEAADLLIQYHPSAALRILRQTRSRRLSDQDETQPYRRQLLAAAHAALGRTQLAKFLGRRSKSS